MSDPAREQRFEATVWGARGTAPRTGSETIVFGGDTSCLEVRCGESRLLFDMGSGALALGRSLSGCDPFEAELFLTHTHYDHILGLPSFKPAYLEQNRFRIWAGHLSPERSIRAVLEQLTDPAFWPAPLGAMRACIAFEDFEAGEELGDFGGARVRTAKLVHPGGATGYRIDFGGRSLCYVTDTEHTIGRHDEAVLRLVDGADLVFYDSTYSDEQLPSYVGWGHSTWQEGVRLAERAGVGRWLAFHHDPLNDDAALEEIDAKMGRWRLGCGVARQGATYRL